MRGIEFSIVLNIVICHLFALWCSRSVLAWDNSRCSDLYPWKDKTKSWQWKIFLSNSTLTLLSISLTIWSRSPGSMSPDSLENIVNLFIWSQCEYYHHLWSFRYLVAVMLQPTRSDILNFGNSVDSDQVSCPAPLRCVSRQYLFIWCGPERGGYKTEARIWEGGDRCSLRDNRVYK